MFYRRIPLKIFLQISFLIALFEIQNAESSPGVIPCNEATRMLRVLGSQNHQAHTTLPSEIMSLRSHHAEIGVKPPYLPFGYRHPSGSQGSVVLVHGYGHSAAHLREAAGVFYNAGYDVVVPTLRGHGSTPEALRVQGGTRAKELLNEWRADIREAVGIAEKWNPSVSVVGFSMGGVASIGALGPSVKSVVLHSPTFAVHPRYEKLLHVILRKHERWAIDNPLRPENENPHLYLERVHPESPLFNDVGYAVTPTTGLLLTRELTYQVQAREFSFGDRPTRVVYSLSDTVADPNIIKSIVESKKNVEVEAIAELSHEGTIVGDHASPILLRDIEFIQRHVDSME